MDDMPLFFPAVVADFDGTIRHPPEGKKFINHPEHVCLYEGVFDKLWHHRNHGHIILGLTNQGGVAYGHKTPDDVLREVHKMRQLGEEQGSRWPFHEWYAEYLMEGGSVGPYTARSLSRKPRYGGLAILSQRVWENHQLRPNWDESIFIGDSEEDFKCAKNAGLLFLHAETFRAAAPEEHGKLSVDPNGPAEWDALPKDRRSGD